MTEEDIQYVMEVAERNSLGKKEGPFYRIEGIDQYVVRFENGQMASLVVFWKTPLNRCTEIFIQK